MRLYKIKQDYGRPYKYDDRGFYKVAQHQTELISVTLSVCHFVKFQLLKTANKIKTHQLWNELPQEAGWVSDGWVGGAAAEMKNKAKQLGLSWALAELGNMKTTSELKQPQKYGPSQNLGQPQFQHLWLVWAWCISVPACFQLSFQYILFLKLRSEDVL